MRLAPDQNKSQVTNRIPELAALLAPRKTYFH